LANPAHDNRRYVKLAWIAAVLGLAGLFPARVEAELVAPTAAQGFLATAPDGSPRVAYLADRNVVVARRAAGRWSSGRVGRVPAGRAFVAGLLVDRRGRTSILVQAENGSWLALGRSGGAVRVVARPRKGASFGPAGLALDAAGRPAFAYVLRLKSGKTFLRLVTSDDRGRLRTTGITKAGFPSSSLAPGAAPVLVRGRLHVVETFTSGAIDWQPQRKGTWVGQFLFSSPLGSPTGRVAAAAAGGNLWSAWTQLSSETISVFLSHSAATQDTDVVLEHGIFVSLLLSGGRPEIGAYDFVQIGDWFSYAGIVADDTGPLTELDGRLEGYAVARGGRRQVLLSTQNGLEWFETPSRSSVKVSLSADAAGNVTGRVDGASGGTVQVYRESPTSPRALVATVPLAADGSFMAADTAPTSPTLYRAVYVDGATGIPYASLLRTPVGPGT
jgi:hypothetical protein